MPNWSEGSIKFRGTYENIKRFLEDNIKFNETENCYIYYYEDDDWQEIELHFDRSIYIEDTYRAFVIANSHGSGVFKNRSEDVLSMPVKKAWSWIDNIDLLKDFASKYEIDIRVYGIECGLGFVEEYIILRNGSVDSISHEYENWKWDCPFPYMGG